jgi:small subunit ribosomal protein S1
VAEALLRPLASPAQEQPIVGVAALVVAAAHLAGVLSRDRVEDARSVLKDGDEVEAKITTIDRKNRKISLSIKAKEFAEETEAVQEYTRKPSAAGSLLGDKLKEKLVNKDS